MAVCVCVCACVQVEVADVPLRTVRWGAYNLRIPAYSTSPGVAEQKGGLYENVSFVYGRGWALSFMRPLRVIK